MIDPVVEQKLLNLITALDRFPHDARLPADLNIFEAAGLTRQEIRHSNFLSFLLRPQERHGLNDGFLRRLLQRAIDELSNDAPLSPLTVALADFSDALVRREWRNIDLLVESKNNNFVFVIENKIDSSEGKKQLQKYREIVQAEFPKERKLFCYLSPEGNPPTDESWTPLSYSDIAEALNEAKGHHSSNLTDEARVVLDHYLNLIRRNVVPDQELIEQCRRLYAQHRDAIDLVIKYGEVNAFDTTANRFFENHPEVQSFALRSDVAHFLPTSLVQILPQMEGKPPFSFWFIRSDNKLGFAAGVRPFADDKFNREVLARELITYFKSKKKITPRYTTVYSEYRTLTEEEAADFEGLCSIMEELYQNFASKHLTSISEILHRFFGRDA